MNNSIVSDDPKVVDAEVVHEQTNEPDLKSKLLCADHWLRLVVSRPNAPHWRSRAGGRGRGAARGRARRICLMITAQEKKHVGLDDRRAVGRQRRTAALSAGGLR